MKKCAVLAILIALIAGAYRLIYSSRLSPEFKAAVAAMMSPAVTDQQREFYLSQARLDVAYGNGYPKRQLPMWHRYRVELYPHVPGLGLGSGILDRWGNELEFPSAFRQSRRDGTPRGIIKIRYGGLS